MVKLGRRCFQRSTALRYRATAVFGDSTVMFERAVVIGLRVLEGLFFVGLIGCAVVVCISWISIFKTGFSKKD